MELRFHGWERVINEGRLLEVRQNIINRINSLENELTSEVSFDRRNEIRRVLRAFRVLLVFSDELIRIKKGNISEG